jgi:hypothetical protein
MPTTDRDRPTDHGPTLFTRTPTTPTRRLVTTSAGRIQSIGRLLGLAITALVGLAGPAGATTPDRVYVASRVCTGAAYKPPRITIACGTGQFYAAKLRFTAYGGPVARAKARLVLDDCMPNCAEGRFTSHPGLVTLKDIERCGRRLFYARVAWSFVGHSPVPARTGTESIAPPGACSRVPR